MFLQKAAAYDRHMIQIEEMLDNEKKAQTREEEAEQQGTELELHQVGINKCLNPFTAEGVCTLCAVKNWAFSHCAFLTLILSFSCETLKWNCTG